MDPLTLVLFAIGIGLLIVGAELLVKGAANLATVAGISPLIVGLTVVAFGTSSPELAVSIQSARSGDVEIALGNVVGSNIFNVLLILGLSALVAPLIVSRQLIRLDVPVMISVSVLILLLALDGNISRVESVGLVFLLVLYNGVLIWIGKRSGSLSNQIDPALPDPVPGVGRAGSIPVQIAFVVAGLGLLVLGSRWLVNGAVAIAESLGVSELIIGLTIVAAGTSLPEIATSVLASIRGQREIAVGNVVGSNIFNILSVLGISGLVSAGGIPVPDEMLAFDLPVMLAVAVACLPILFSGYTINRWEGGLFLVYYVAYTLYLLLDAADHDAQDAFGTIMLTFVVPLTVVTLAIVVVREIRSNRQSSGLPSSSTGT